MILKVEEMVNDSSWGYRQKCDVLPAEIHVDDQEWFSVSNPIPTPFPLGFILVSPPSLLASILSPHHHPCLLRKYIRIHLSSPTYPGFLWMFPTLLHAYCLSQASHGSLPRFSQASTKPFTCVGHGRWLCYRTSAIVLLVISSGIWEEGYSPIPGSYFEFPN